MFDKQIEPGTSADGRVIRKRMDPKHLLSEMIGILINGVITQNPVLVQLLGMCPVLAVSTSLENGLGMGLAASAVLICSNIIVSLLRNVIHPKIRIASYIVVIAGFVTAADLLMNAFFHDLWLSLGLFIPLIVVNCIILARAEAFASKNNVWRSALDGIGMGLGFTLAICLLSSIREILGNGTIYGKPLFGAKFQPALMLLSPPGGFLCLGMLIAVARKIMSSRRRKIEK